GLAAPPVWARDCGDAGSGVEAGRPIPAAPSARAPKSAHAAAPIINLVQAMARIVSDSRFATAAETTVVAARPAASWSAALRVERASPRGTTAAAAGSGVGAAARA